MLRNAATVAPFFCLTRAAWMLPYAVAWDQTSGEFHGVASPRGFPSYREARWPASRFLVLTVTYK